MGLTPGQILREVEIPLALPVVAEALRIALVLGVATAAVGALAGAATLGTPIIIGLQNQNEAYILQGAAATAALAFLADGLLAARARRRLRSARCGGALAESPVARNNRPIWSRSRCPCSPACATSSTRSPTRTRPSPEARERLTAAALLVLVARVDGRVLAGRGGGPARDAARPASRPQPRTAPGASSTRSTRSDAVVGGQALGLASRILQEIDPEPTARAFSRSPIASPRSTAFVHEFEDDLDLAHRPSSRPRRRRDRGDPRGGLAATSRRSGPTWLSAAKKPGPHHPAPGTLDAGPGRAPPRASAATASTSAAPASAIRCRRRSPDHAGRGDLRRPDERQRPGRLHQARDRLDRRRPCGRTSPSSACASARRCWRSISARRVWPHPGGRAEIGYYPLVPTTAGHASPKAGARPGRATSTTGTGRASTARPAPRPSRRATISRPRRSASAPAPTASSSTRR